ncbi:MAG: exo-alpha-sialidase [Acidimicrobiia bacterium]|nr:exo-alpha-sialidase [Acidimicrobiia bacterium]
MKNRLTVLLRTVGAILVIQPSCWPGVASAELGVQVGDPVIVYGASSELWHGGPLLQLKDGSLWMGGAENSLRSKDRGVTWMTQPPLSGHVLQRRDGSFFLLDGRTRPTQRAGVFAGKRRILKRLEDLESPASPQPRWDDVELSVPEWAPMTGDDAKTKVETLTISGPMLELADGTLLAGNYGNFAGDKVPMEGFVASKGEKWFKYRTYLLASTDGGSRWNYLSTVAYDGKTGQESFCEPGLVDLGSGELLAVMRTGRFGPMCQARSMDGGKSWGKPESLRTLGLAPQLALLPNGILVCSFGWRPTKNQVVGGGRPAEQALADYRKRYQAEVGIDDPSAAAGDYVMASADKGRSWTKPKRIAAPLTVGYTYLAPNGQDSCLILTQKIFIPGEPEASVLEKWKLDWIRWRDLAKRILEARQITIRR